MPEKPQPDLPLDPVMSTPPSEVARLASEGFYLFEQYPYMRKFDEEIAFIITHVPNAYQFSELEEIGVWDTFIFLLDHDQDVPRETIVSFQKRLDDIFSIYRAPVAKGCCPISPAFLVRRAINDVFTIIILDPGKEVTALEPGNSEAATGNQAISLEPGDETITLEPGDDTTTNIIKPGDEAFVGLVARYIDSAAWGKFLWWKRITPTTDFLARMLTIHDGIGLMKERPPIEATPQNLHDQADIEWNNIKKALSNVANTKDQI